jgi:hypothetical protein
MWKLSSTLGAFLALAVVAIPAQEAAIRTNRLSQADLEHTKRIDQVMDSIATIKPGMTRQDILKIFTTEGGLSSRGQQRYVYKHCPHIKVDVEFAPVDGGPPLSADDSADKIIKISRPFLEYTIMD